jgi:hypothetical protein
MVSKGPCIRLYVLRVSVPDCAPGAARGAARARGTAQLRGCGSAADRGGRATPHAPRGRGVRRGNAPPPARARAPSPDTRRAGPRKSAAGETGSLFGIVILVRLLYIRGSSGHYTHTRVEGTGAVATRTRSDAHAHTTTQSAAPDLGGSPSPRNGRHTYGHNMQGEGRRSLTERTAQPHSGHACEVTNRSHYAANALAASPTPSWP